MKIIRLLHRCLAERRRRRSQRSRTAQPSIGRVSTATDIALESRILLSATPTVQSSDSADATSAESTSQASSDTSTQQNNAESGTTTSGNLTVTISANDTTGNTLYYRGGSSGGSLQEYLNGVVVLEDAMDVAFDGNQYGVRQPIVPQDTSQKLHSLLPENVHVEVGISLTSLQPESQLPPDANARIPGVSASSTSLETTAPVVAGRQTAGVAVQSTGPSHRILFSQNSSHPHVTGVISQNHSEIARGTSVSHDRDGRGSRLDDVADSTFAYDGASVADLIDSVFVGMSQTASNLIGLSSFGHQSETPVAAVELLPSLLIVEELSALESADLSHEDWLRLQLNEEEHANAHDSADESPDVTASADVSADEEGHTTRKRRALSRLEAEPDAEIQLLYLSDEPPEQPERSGILQRLKFDCNPRGPPVNDSISVSGQNRTSVGISQLQRLRYSIAPRGPSVASAL